MKEIVKLGLILFLVSAVAAAALAYSNAVTKGPIEESKRLADTETRKTLIKEADNFNQLTIENQGDYPLITEVYEGVKGDELCGFIFKTAPKGYAGPVEVLIGIKADGTIAGVSIGSHKETPGLGSKAANVKFNGQYSGKNAVLKVIKSGTPKDDEILAISGATITSKAVTSGVNEALSYYNDNLNKNN